MLKGAIDIATPNGTAQPTPKASSGGMGQAQKQSQMANMMNYGERLAKRANPDMNNG
jgi:hypothetical protein